MPRQSASHAPASLDAYTAKRDFAVSAEPAAKRGRASGRRAPIFVVQKHAARRLHWDFRLEHDGVLWSWAVPKGPSLDPADKRLAVHVEDHPLDYADFAGAIPAGQDGAGTVETWDRGTWRALGDAAAGLRDGELKFVLDGSRLRGGFVLVRLKPRANDKAENWLLIKEHDEAERAGETAEAIETRPNAATPSTQPPVPGAKRGKLPMQQAPQLATPVETAPDGDGWLSEVKFDGYRLLAFVEGGAARLITRNGHDWTAKLPHLAQSLVRLDVEQALLDGELVALRPDGVSCFAALQDALSSGRDAALRYYAFDLLHLNGWDLRPCRLEARKAALAGLAEWQGRLRYSDHVDADSARVRAQACAMGLEGVICKQADAPYRAGRGAAWVKLKCQDRDEFVVFGWTPPDGARTGIGALHLGFFDRRGMPHYVGGVGTGFADRDLTAWRKRLESLRADAPAGLRYAGETPTARLTWVRPELVVEVRHAGWTGAGRLRQAVCLGLREDKPAADVVRDPTSPAAERRTLAAAPPRIVRASAAAAGQAGKRAAAPLPGPARIARPAQPDGVRLTHEDKDLWPGISKRDLAEYWRAVADAALPGIAHRPLALVRCPDGIDGQHFFQKHPSAGFAPHIRAAAAGDAPYLAIDDRDGLLAATQMAAIELHTWGASEADPLRPDRLVFDLDPGEGVTLSEIVSAAKDVRQRLEAVGLAAFCRTSGGKGLHVVAPLRPHADWDAARAWCRGFAQRMERDQPARYVATVPKQRRRGHILVDWLRNGKGATAIASFSPRARPGAGVATPLAWREVTGRLDPAAFNLRTVPARLKRQRQDPWHGFDEAARPLPEDGDG